MVHITCIQNVPVHTSSTNHTNIEPRMYVWTHALLCSVQRAGTNTSVYNGLFSSKSMMDCLSQEQQSQGPRLAPTTHDPSTAAD